MNNRSARTVTLAAAILVLNVSLTFDNLWPTPAIGWHGELSIELAVLLLVLVAADHWVGRPSRAVIGWMSALWLVLIVGRYAEVTASALYGRDINLYWDLRYMPDVTAMVTAAAPVWLVAAALTAAAVVLGLLFVLIRWALGRLGGAMADAHERRAVEWLAAAALLLFIAQHVSAHVPQVPSFSTPVTTIYTRQARLVALARSASRGATTIGRTPPLTSDLALVKQTDVLVIFIESYGAVSYDRPEIAERLRPARARFEADVQATNRGVVSAYVESPTFGGSSWLAHLSLLSGVEVRDPDAYSLLMTQKRETAVTAFSRHGFRTVAMMPGLKKSWPEGAFYGFDDIYDARRIDYRGPWFGWFGIPDQATLANLDRLQEPKSRAPYFVFLPTLSTHFPFGPTPPYQDDWRRMLTDTPYEPTVYDGLTDEPDWTNFAPSYAKAVAYAFQSLGGYLRRRADRDFVMILLGDHQPPAAVSGEKARWDVPVHVIASRRQILDQLVARGFKPGLAPERPAIGRMHALLPVLLDSFGTAPR